LTLRGMYEAIRPPTESQQELRLTYKYNVWADLKTEYVLEEEPSTLWAALQTRHEQ
jgi:hypothetical protein